jgi:hypothetical protein
MYNREHKARASRSFPKGHQGSGTRLIRDDLAASARQVWAGNIVQSKHFFYTDLQYTVLNRDLQDIEYNQTT